MTTEHNTHTYTRVSVENDNDTNACVGQLNKKNILSTPCVSDVIFV